MPPSTETCGQSSKSPSDLLEQFRLPVCNAAAPWDEGVRIDESIFRDVDRVEGELEKERQDEIGIMTDAFSPQRFYPVSGNTSILPRGVRRIFEEQGVKEDEMEFSWERVAGAAIPFVTLRKVGRIDAPKPGFGPVKGPEPVGSAASFQVIGGVAVVVMSDKLVDWALDKFHGPKSLRGPLQFLAPMAVYDTGYFLGFVETPSFSTFGRSMPVLTAANWGYSKILNAAGFKSGTDANTYGSMGLTVGSYVALRELAKKSPQLATALFRGAGIRVSGAGLLSTGEMTLGARAGSYALRGAGVVGAAMMVDMGLGWTTDILDESESGDPAMKMENAARVQITQRALCGAPEGSGPMSDDPTSPHYDPLYVPGFDPGIVGDITCNTGTSGLMGRLMQKLGNEDMASTIDRLTGFWLRSSGDFADWLNQPQGVLADLVLSSTTSGSMSPSYFWSAFESNLSHFYREERPSTMKGSYDLITLTGFKSAEAKELTEMISSEGHIINRDALRRHLIPIVTQRLEGAKGLFANRLVTLGLGRMEGERLVPIQIKEGDLNGDQRWFNYGDGIDPSERTHLRDEIVRLQAALKILNP